MKVADAAGAEFAFTISDSSGPQTPTATAITVSGNYKTAYAIGDTFDSTGIVVMATMSEGEPQDVTTETTFSGFDSATAGVKTITATYGDLTTTFTVTVVDSSAPTADGYTVSMPDPKTASVGDAVTIPVTIGYAGEGNVTTYNAYDMSFSYDADKLTPTMTAANTEGSRITLGDGTIRIQRYGEDAALGSINLTFTAEAAGDATVTCTSARVDNAAHAISDDMPEATITNASTTVTIAAAPTTYTVIYNADLLIPQDGYSSPVNEGGSFVFKPKDGTKTYTITYTMGDGDPVELTAGDGGWYTVSDITGNVVITCTEVVAPDTYSVSFTGSGAADVADDAAPTVTAGESYSFTIEKEEGYDYIVSYTMGENDPVELTADGNEYTISNVTGDLVITIVKNGEELNVVVTADYVQLDNYTVCLITVTGDPGEGKVYKYDGGVMYKTTAYGEDVYSYLVILGDESAPTENEAREKITVSEGTCDVVTAQSFDVNGSGKVDVNDAQFAYNIYKGVYGEFTSDVTMLKFLKADVNGDGKVNTADAIAIVAQAV